MTDIEKLRAAVLGLPKAGDTCGRRLDQNVDCDQPAVGIVQISMAQNHPNSEFGAPMLASIPACEEHLAEEEGRGMQVVRGVQ